MTILEDGRLTRGFIVVASNEPVSIENAVGARVFFSAKGAADMLRMAEFGARYQRFVIASAVGLSVGPYRVNRDGRILFP